MKALNVILSEVYVSHMYSFIPFTETKSGLDKM